MSGKKIAIIAIFSAIALIISLFEYLLPPIVPILPFARVGISHIIIISALILLGKKEAIIIFMVRTFFIALFQGNPSMLLYSVPAGLISILEMIILIKANNFGIPAISALSGAIHNLIQIIIASLIMKSTAVFVYLPYLMFFGMTAGSITGIVSFYLIKRLDKYLLNSESP